MSTELEKLEHQPTNAALQQEVHQLRLSLTNRMDAMNHNMIARIVNASLHNANDQLVALVNPHTNAPVEEFPDNSATLAGLSWAEKRALGISLAMNDPGAGPGPAARATFFAQLRITIGLKPNPA
ncbi:hypothetical protein VE02_09412 [Pseudogymnoascus sp. 03VT05]|nr:hypothetical protein VE02_09412 [Pseudogymnoascus sp. 03VT05]